MINNIFVLEQSTDSSWMKDLHSVGWHLISDEVEGKIDVLEEQRDGEKSIEELTWGLIFPNLHPVLHLLTVCTLDKVVRVSEVHILWPHAAKFVWRSAGTLNIHQMRSRSTYID